jgi:acetate kinase
LQQLGIELDATRNASAKGETRVSSDTSRTQVWVIPTNEELIVARQTKSLLTTDH